MRCGHAQRKVWGAGLGLGLGLGLGGALYYNRPTRSLFNVGVCMRSRDGGSAWLGASRGAAGHALQEQSGVETDCLSVGTVWQAFEGETLHRRSDRRPFTAGREGGRRGEACNGEP